jgi:hypothetical protein
MLIEEFNEIQKINETIAKTLTEMSSKSSDSDEFSQIADQLTKLIKVKEVVANICLKNEESVNKKSEVERSNNLKVAELAQRKQELESSSSLKTSELNRRKIEFETTTALRQTELDLKTEELEDRRKVSKETLAVIGANIAGIVMILGYERANVIASKALSFVSKLR